MQFKLLKSLMSLGDQKATIYNCWHIRSPNGMLYYAIDYIKNDNKSKIILCRQNAVFDILYGELCDLNIPVIKLSLPSYAFCLVFIVLYSKISRFSTFTPSCHPIPFLSNNTIIVHDPYPFIEISFLSFLRKIILYLGLMSTKYTLGYINKTESLAFCRKLSNLKLMGTHQIYHYPNLTPTINLTKVTILPLTNPLRIGLCGTNSSKKNYKKLIESMVSRAISPNNILFIVYGFDSPYIRSIISQSPYKFVILDSRYNSFEDLASNINILASVSSSEGFCRPISAMLQANITTLLVDSPTMREFYSSSKSIFFENTDDLSKHLTTIIRTHLIHSPF